MLTTLDAIAGIFNKYLVFLIRPKTMLVQVTIENFRSFREPITFSMLGVNSDPKQQEEVLYFERRYCL